ncbi:group I intron-associated PD-(D/E)XK endonuclease [Halarchaeum acidiphilum]|uniref:group I intron-associated PD-(D/E)XK endonuclease n=1 Tax=Halarchaeum acidiphilum TaxID=489138 RepID=UPI0005D1C1B2|nr:group I intron-associated PD-(D/E)XK endonuclease [Halarchaeum acidiphilum]
MPSNNGASRGDASETLVAYDILDNGYRIAYPHGHAQDYDLIADVDGRLLKIQVKTATNTRKRQYELRLKNADNYNSEHVDLFAAGVHSEKAAFYVPFNEMEESQRVTFTPPEEMGSDANRERANLFTDYSLEAVLDRIYDSD